MAGEKRSQEHEDVDHREETIVLIDIEGTTTSISFVKETLFPYVRENLKDYIEKKWDDSEFKDDLEKLKEQATKDQNEKVGEGESAAVPITGETPDEVKASLMKNVLWQMDNDRKTGALKQLQGHMWRDAYKSGAVKGHVYEDVPKAFEEWTKNGRKLYIYSSGSVEAQKLLFGNSEHGDLLKYFNGYFDTEVGPKQESASYKKILSEIEKSKLTTNKNVLFLTDVAKEAKAAVEAGLSAVIVVRDGNVPLTPVEKVYPTIKSFLDLTFTNSAKRQKLATSPGDAETETETEMNKTGEQPKKAADEPPKTTEPSSSIDTDTDVEMKDVSDTASATTTTTTSTATSATKQKNDTESDVKKTMVVDKEEDPKPDKESVAPVQAEETSSKEQAMECEMKVDTETDKKITEKEPESDKATKKNDESVTSVKPASQQTSTTCDVDKKADADTKSTVDTVPTAAIIDEKIVEPSKPESVTKPTIVAEKIETEKTDKTDNVCSKPNVDKMETEVSSNKTDAAGEKIIEATKVVSEEETPAKTVDTSDEKSKTENKEQTVVSKDEKETKVEMEVDEKKPSSSVEEVKQNGDSKAPDEKVEPSIVANGSAEKAEKNDEVNGDAKEKETSISHHPDTTEKADTTETDKKTSILDKNCPKAASTTSATATVAEVAATDSEVTECEAAKKDNDEKDQEDEKKKAKEEVVANKKLNGSTPTTETSDNTTTETKTHRNGVNDNNENNKQQNGDDDSLTTDVESIKVKKVVDNSVADSSSTGGGGAGEPEVVSPTVAVVAATS